MQMFDGADEPDMLGPGSLLPSNLRPLLSYPCSGYLAVVQVISQFKSKPQLTMSNIQLRVYRVGGRGDER